MERIVYIGLDNEKFWRRSELHNIFERYGTLEKIIMSYGIYDHESDHRPTHFFGCFEDAASARRCLEDKKELRKNYRLDIRLYGEEEEDQSFEFTGPENDSMPSLMNLNENCIERVMNFLSSEIPMQQVCLRLRRIWGSQWCKRLLVLREPFRNLDVVFHYGPQVKQVRLHRSMDDDVLRIVSLFCCNLKRLHLRVESFQRNELSHLLNILPTLRELVLKVDFFCASNGFQRLEEVFNRGEGLRRVFVNTEPDRFDFSRSNMPFLTTLMIRWIGVNVGDVLSKFPNLITLSCTWMSCTGLPATHGLQNLCLQQDREGLKLNLIVDTCKNLKQLRINAMYNDDMLEIIKNINSLEGLAITRDFDEYICPAVMEFCLHLPGNIKTFILDLDVPPQLSENFLLAIARLEKLEMVFWSEETHGDITAMLSKRKTLSRLRIITEDPLSEQIQALFNCELFDPKDFGRFSIFYK